MKLLLDTHAFWWAVTEPERLTVRVQDLLQNPAHTILVSSINWWELITKRQRGRLMFPNPVAWLPEMTRSLGVAHVTAVSASHVLELESLPALHKDPFDRLLIAQARVERAHLVSADDQVRAYPVECIWE